MKIGIIGNGVVGKAIDSTLSRKHTVAIYDKFFEVDSFEKLLGCKFVFISVPTPFNLHEGTVDDSAVRESLEKLEEKHFRGIIILKSTLPPGNTKAYSKNYNLNIVYNPEFLRESKSPNQDFANQHTVVIGCENISLFENVKIMYESVLQDTCHYYNMSYEAAEMVKYSQNLTLASRVAIANIVYDACQKYGVEYNNLKSVAFDSFDILGPHMVEVPGPDGLRGFGGKCLPKDVLGFNSIYNSIVIESIINYNNKLRDNIPSKKNES